MALTPVAGIQRLRALQLGLESSFNTQVAATRRYPWSFTPTVNPNWTFPTADTGTLDNAIAPSARAMEITGTSTGELYSNDLPTIISAGVMGGLALATSGTAKILTAAPASLTQDVFDTYTIEAFDDATGDAWAFPGSLLDSFTLEYPQDLGPVIFTGNWRGGKPVYPATPTGALTVDTSPVPFYAGDTYFFINDTSGAIGTTQLVSQIYGATLSVNNNLDAKRFANGSNSMRNVQGYSRAQRVLDFSWTFAKAAGAIAEAVKWIAASPTERFAEIRTTSSVAASAGVPHQMRWRIPGYWISRNEETINTNTGFSLAGQQVFDTGLLYPFQVVSQSTRSALT